MVQNDKLAKKNLAGQMEMNKNIK